MRTIVCVAMLAALVGCAAQSDYMWVRPNTSQTEFDLDRARCIYEAEAAVATYGSNTPTPRSFSAAAAQGFATGLGAAIEANRLAVLCMRARGYAQQPVDMAAVAAARANPDAVWAQPPSPAPTAPTVQVTPLTRESKYMFVAERFAKTNGCQSPVASMNLKSSDSETFTISCSSGDPLVVRCEGSACRSLQ